MSDNTYSKEKLEVMKENILKERAESLIYVNKVNEIQKKGSKENSGDLSGYAFHQADQGSDTNSMEKAVYLYDNEQKKLKKLNQALEKVYDGDYGVCEICGELIGESRLKAIPYARFCIDCKSKEELRKPRK
ncbi:MAG: TraR/DksA C4-type zinc finger protein [Candidatus Zophobacter franzmannii]|jgi:DnaK suppressor protein|nr:TraR/DksA C4-type zinc finger protein [Candidatus Zophobacter franzmannii]